VVAFGILAAWMAARLDRLPALWFAFGAILGPVAVVLLALAPPAWCHTCLMPSRGYLTTCWWCGANVRAPGPGTMAAIGPTKAPASRRSKRQQGPPVRQARPSPVPPPVADAAGQEPATVQGSREPVASAPAATLAGAARVEPTSLTNGRRAGVAVATAPRAAPRSVESKPRLLATGVYWAGTARLDMGARYGIVVDGPSLRLTGPYDPTVVALEHPLAGTVASTAHGRLLVAIPDGQVAIGLVFSSVTGGSVETVAGLLNEAAEAAAS
jgi:hypothetical protein